LELRGWPDEKGTLGDANDGSEATPYIRIRRHLT
jgi:hypothetical protein